jgi:hypothetical protein
MTAPVMSRLGDFWFISYCSLLLFIDPILGSAGHGGRIGVNPATEM